MFHTIILIPIHWLNTDFRRIQDFSTFLIKIIKYNSSPVFFKTRYTFLKEMPNIQESFFGNPWKSFQIDCSFKVSVFSSNSIPIHSRKWVLKSLSKSQSIFAILMFLIGRYFLYFDGHKITTNRNSGCEFFNEKQLPL